MQYRCPSKGTLVTSHVSGTQQQGLCTQQQSCWGVLLYCYCGSHCCTASMGDVSAVVLLFVLLGNASYAVVMDWLLLWHGMCCHSGCGAAEGGCRGCYCSAAAAVHSVPIAWSCNTVGGFVLFCRLTNSIMMHGRNNGKKLMAVSSKAGHQSAQAACEQAQILLEPTYFCANRNPAPPAKHSVSARQTAAEEIALTAVQPLAAHVLSTGQYSHSSDGSRQLCP